MSLALLILYAELMTVMRVVHLHFSASRYRETLGRSLVCLDFSHSFVLLCIVNDLTYYIIKGSKAVDERSGAAGALGVRRRYPSMILIWRSLGAL